MAKVKTKYAKLTDIAEAFRELFVERDGAFYLDAEAVDGFTVEDTTALRNSLQNAKHERGTFKAQLEALGGLTPEQLTALRAELDAAKKADPDEKRAKQWADKERALTEKHTGDLKAATDKASLIERRWVGSSLRAAIKASLAKYRAKGGGDALVPFLERQVRGKIVGEGDTADVTPYVVDANGQERISRQAGNTGAMSLDELVETMSTSKEHGWAFDPEGTSGSGAGGGNGNPRGGASQYRLTTEEAKDPAKYRAVRAAAEKAGASVEIV